MQVVAKRWKVEVHAKLDAVLMLSSVNLPGGELRRRSEEDERMMRDYLKEGDLISAEVQNVMSDGSLSLHTRSLKYGKLGQGVLLQVSHSRPKPFKGDLKQRSITGPSERDEIKLKKNKKYTQHFSQS